MITIILSTILCGVLGTLICYRIRREKEFCYIFSNIIIFSVLGLVFGFLISSNLPVHYNMKLKQIKEIESFGDSKSLEGSFYLGSGNLDGSFKYVFYERINNGFVYKTIDVENVVVKYTEELPVIEVYESVVTEDLINWFSFHEVEKSYIVYIPKGSITQGFKLDLE